MVTLFYYNPSNFFIMVKISIRRTSPQNRNSARRVNTGFHNAKVRNIITKQIRDGSSIRAIQRSVARSGIKISQKDIFSYIRQNYADRTFNKWLTSVNKKVSALEFANAGFFTKKPDGVQVRGFVRGFDIRTNTKVFYTVDTIVPKNSSVVEVLQTIRNRGFERLSDSLEVRISGTGFFI